VTSLGLPEAPDELLATHASTLDEALRYVAGQLAANTNVRVDEVGKIHMTSHKAVEESPSLIDLRKRVAAMLPRVDIGEAILEVMGWVPGLPDTTIQAPGPPPTRRSHHSTRSVSCHRAGSHAKQPHPAAPSTPS
jgi:hypothetical protein